MYLSFIFPLLMVLPFSVSAHMGEVGKIMNQMMGPDSYNSVAAIDEQLLGPQRYERMIDLMDKMMQGTLSADEQKEMIAFMQDNKSAAGISNMMQRMMLATVYKQQNPGLNPSGWGMMNNMMGSNGFQSPLALVVYVVWLAVGILLVIWLIRNLTSKKS